MSTTPQRFVDANPYPWPYNGALRPDNTALIVIDMQTDFCGKGGYVDVMGYDLSLTQAPIEPIRRLLAVMRAQGFHIIHTREGHRPDLADPRIRLVEVSEYASLRDLEQRHVAALVDVLVGALPA